jgi:hypothetical protein
MSEIDYFLNWDCDKSGSGSVLSGCAESHARSAGVPASSSNVPWDQTPRLERTRHADIMKARSEFFQPARKNTNGPLSTDYGVIIRTAHPFAPHRSIVILYGCYGYETLAAVRFTNDKRFLQQLKADPQGEIKCIIEVRLVKATPQDCKLVHLNVSRRGSKLSDSEQMAASLAGRELTSERD